MVNFLRSAALTAAIPPINLNIEDTSQSKSESCSISRHSSLTCFHSINSRCGKNVSGRSNGVLPRHDGSKASHLNLLTSVSI